MSSKLPQFQPPSPFRPFLRRFTDERALELSETIALYNEVGAAYRASPWAQANAIERVHGYIADQVGEIAELPQSQTILAALDRCAKEVLALETTIFSSPTIDWDHAVLSLKEQVDLRRFLRAQEHFLANADRVGELLATAIGNVFGGLIGALPALTESASDPTFTVPLVSLLDDPGNLVDRIIGTICTDPLAEAGLFTTLQQRFYDNVCAASGVLPDQERRKPLVTADESDLEPIELLEAYLKGTPFLDLFLSPIPFTIPEAIRFEHTHIVAGTGHGKTQLLQHLILRDLKSEQPPALIVIDSQGEMLAKLRQLDLFTRAPLSDKLIVIDPEDVEFPPALNMFDMSNARLAGYSLAHREQIEASVIELYNYIFGALAAELTQKQGTAFAYVTRLMLTIPGATIHTLRELMEDGATSVEASPFGAHIGKLDPTSQAFFQNQFFSKSFAQTRQQIARRLYGVLQVPAFDRMFSSATNKLDMFEAMQNGKIVLINTSKALLKSNASALFGRYMIALTIKAAFERVAATRRDPAFLIVDEAQEYFDENLEALLSQARKFNVGIVFAHQHLDQLTTELRSSVAANTSIKLAGGVSDRDARALAPDMRTTADFIASTRKRARSTEFACYVRNMTASAVRLSIPFGTVEQAPKMSPQALAEFIAHNRQLYTTGREQPRPAAASPDMAPPAPTSKSVSDDDWRS